MEPAPASVLLQALARHTRRQHASIALRAVATGVMVMVGAQPLLMGIDRFGAPSALRWTAWVIVIVTSLSVVAWLGRALVRRRQLVEVAKDLEHRAAISGGLLVAGTSFNQHAPRDASEWMINRTVVLASKAAEDIRDWKRVSPVAWRAPTGAAVLSAFLVTCALFPAARPWLARAAYPGSDRGRPGDLLITAVGGDRRVAAGSEPELAVDIAAGIPSQVTATIAWKDGRIEQRALYPVDGEPAGGSRWHLTLPPVTGDLTWQVEANRQPGGPVRGESDRRRIDLTAGFVPAGFHLRVSPPSYANLPNQIVTGDCAAVAGSQVDLEVTIRAAQTDSGPNPLLVAATVVIDPDDGATTEIPATISGSTVRANWVVRRSQRWGLRLIANGGNETLPDRHWRIIVTNDLAPQIQLTAVPATMAADALAPVAVTADDDVALAETVLEVRRDHGAGALLTSMAIPGDTPRRRVTEILIDGAALGVTNGDTLALVPVASDRAGQTTRGEPTLVTVTADGAGWEQLAENLARVVTAAEVASTALPALSDAWDRCGVDPTARTMLAGRLKSWCRTLTDACELWPPLADVPVDQAARQGVADLSWWATHAVTDVLAELARGNQPVQEPARPLVPGRLRVIADDLHHLMLTIQPHREATLRSLFRRIAVAEAIAAHHHAASLRADLAWLTVPVPGLIAEFSSDDDHAPVRAGGNEVPAIEGRDVPGHGHDHVRIRWHGAIHVPRPDLALELTADDGVALTISGIDHLPPEAWGDQPPTTWKSGPLPVGWHPLAIRWRQSTGGSLLRVAWAGSATPITADELRAVEAPEWLMATDGSFISAHTAALEHHLRRLARGVGSAAHQLAAPRDGAWTAESLTQVLALADQVAGQQPEVADSDTTSGPLAVSLSLADRALDRARSEPKSPSGRQSVAVAWGWLAHAADASGKTTDARSMRVRQEAVLSTALSADVDPSAEIEEIENESARLRENLKPSTDRQPVTAVTRPAAILAGREQARTALAVACGTLALELRESLPLHTVQAQAIEAFEARVRRTPDANESPRIISDTTTVAEAQALIDHLVSGPAREAAVIALAQAPGGPTDGAARRLAAAIAQVGAACRRLAALAQRPAIAMPVRVSEPLAPAKGATDAGFSRARLQPPTLNDRGIEGFRPDQQSAIRAYLLRMRQHQPGAP